MKPEIVSIVPYKILPAQLGGEKGIALFNQYLASYVSLTAIATKNNDPAYAKNYRMLNILSNGKSKYANPFLYFLVKRELKSRKATHLLIEHPYFGWLAWLLKKTMNITWVVHSHNIEYMRSKSIGRSWWRALLWYERWVYRTADQVFFISEDDKNHAVDVLGVEVSKSTAITYGIEQASLPVDIKTVKLKVMGMHGIEPDEKILLFNGALYHHTNYDALTVILEKINPELLKRQLRYKILVCGKGLPASFNQLKDYADKNIIYAGFVDDISIYFQAADIFLNPIISGGGVKTKAIEAIAMDCTVVSTEIGALGLVREVCGNKLRVVADGDWTNFTNLVEASFTSEDHTPTSFFDYYYWGSISRKVAAILQESQITNNTNYPGHTA